MSNKIMLIFLVMFCVCTFTAQNLFAEVHITFDEMGEIETYHDDGVGEWYANIIGGLTFSGSEDNDLFADEITPYVRIDMMNAVFSHLTVGPSFCISSYYTTEDTGHSVQRQFRTTSASNQWAFLNIEEQNLYENYEVLLSARLYLLPVEYSVNFFLQASGGFSYENKRSNLGYGKHQYVPSNFSYWLDNPSGGFYDSVLDSRSEYKTSTKLQPVIDISVGFEFGKAIIINAGVNGCSEYGAIYVAAGIKF